MKQFTVVCLLAAGLLTGCHTPHRIVAVEGSRIHIDSCFDGKLPQEGVTFLTPYKNQVDASMQPVVGYTETYMEADRPESRLSNLLADILVWAVRQWGEEPDFAVINIGSIRAALPKGPITRGDVLAMSPFNNRLCVLTLSGERVRELFQQIAAAGGEGVSHGVHLLITNDGRSSAATLHGKEIDPKGAYRIATIDYVAEGNDKMEAFKAATHMMSPQSEDNNISLVIIDYLRAHQPVHNAIEGRVVMQKGETK